MGLFDSYRQGLGYGYTGPLPGAGLRVPPRRPRSVPPLGDTSQPPAAFTIVGEPEPYQPTSPYDPIQAAQERTRAIEEVKEEYETTPEEKAYQTALNEQARFIAGEPERDYQRKIQLEDRKAQATEEESRRIQDAAQKERDAWEKEQAEAVEKSTGKAQEFRRIVAIGRERGLGEQDATDMALSYQRTGISADDAAKRFADYDKAEADKAEAARRQDMEIVNNQNFAREDREAAAARLGRTLAPEKPAKIEEPLSYEAQAAGLKHRYTEARSPEERQKILGEMQAFDTHRANFRELGREPGPIPTTQYSQPIGPEPPQQPQAFKFNQTAVEQAKAALVSGDPQAKQEAIEYLTAVGVPIPQAQVAAKPVPKIQPAEDEGSWLDVAAPGIPIGRWLWRQANAGRGARYPW